MDEDLEELAEMGEFKEKKPSSQEARKTRDKAPWYKTAGCILLFFVIYVLLINIFNTSDMDADEARHGSQGIILAEYIGSEGSDSYRGFVDAVYTSRYPQAGYPALYDPPGHALFLAGAFSLFGKGMVTARIASQILIGLLLVLLYLLYVRVLKERSLVCSGIALFFLFPFTFLIARRVMLAIPVALLTAGWYYFTFLPPKKFRGKGITGTNKTIVQIAGGGLCFLGASFMMYQTLIYVPIFMIVYTLIELYRKKAKFFDKFFSGTVFVMLIQSLIVLIPILWWFSVSFSGSSTIKDLLLRAGTQEVKGGEGIAYYFSFFIQVMTGTLLVAAIGLASLRNNRFVRKHWPMLLFVGLTLISASILLSNKQLRYITHIIPFVALLAIVGLQELSEMSEDYYKTFWGLLCCILVICAGFSLYSAYGYSQEHGVVTPLFSYLDAEPVPRTFVLLDLDASHEPFAYTHTPDTFLFNTMSIDAPGQSMVYLTSSRVREFAVALDQIDYSNLYVFVFDPEAESLRGAEFNEFFIANGFAKKHFYPYTFYHHTVDNPQPISFASIADKDEVDRLVTEADGYFAKGEFIKALPLLHKALELRPMHIRLRIGLATTYLSQAQIYISQEEYAKALAFVEEAQKIYPWILDEIEGTTLHEQITALLEAYRQSTALTNSTPVATA